ncbi:PREDICTED: uncharacterized protein LOC109472735 [Branchiostoma belcheri]|uniref:Uncharacterized protein LOC109472735 n=1 Tax=Branchiostoma belcheri TaxID=7741 RepID=A0A6P4ZEP6_BRABE|nr:PREDICTED: uncharacterized protein LOC109472735 [Branchiostoma belcheri]
MATGGKNIALFVLVFAVYASVCCCQTHQSNVCTYYYDARYSEPQGNLANCTWYSNNCCCRRTEVTSVASSMYPLFGATQKCRNVLNYMMCYFCSPEQYLWYYDNRVHVCGRFCELVYRECGSASYEGVAIASAYESGWDFCQAQTYLVSDELPCFDYDPKVFGGGGLVKGCREALAGLALLVLIINFRYSM